MFWWQSTTLMLALLHGSFCFHTFLHWTAGRIPCSAMLLVGSTPSRKINVKRPSHLENNPLETFLTSSISDSRCSSSKLFISDLMGAVRSFNESRSIFPSLKRCHCLMILFLSLFILSAKSIVSGFFIFDSCVLKLFDVPFQMSPTKILIERLAFMV